MPEPALLSYGQLSVWRDVRDLSRERRHEANTRSIWLLPPPESGPSSASASVSVAEVERAVRALCLRHESLRTVYDLADTYAPTQRTMTSCEVESGVAECAPDRPEEFDALVDGLAARPFDLETGPSWRYRIVTCDGRPHAVVVVKHHITADGWSDDALQRDFHALLRGPGAGSGALPAAPRTPRELAAWQRSTGLRNRHVAMLAHWERIFGSCAASLRADDAGPASAEALQCSIGSRAAHAAATRLAQRYSVPVSSVVLAAFVRSVARNAGAGTPVAQLMSSNRFVPPWNTVVSSMNQWTATPLEAPAEAFAPFVRHVHAQSLLAYRHGMYDVDEVDALRDKARDGREPYDATCAFNFLTGAAPPPAANGPAEAEPELAWEVPFSRIGHPCYLRAVDLGGQALHLRLRTLGLPKELTRDVLAGTFAALTESSPADV